MQQLSRDDQDLIASIHPANLCERTIAWANLNSGTTNLAGLAQQAELLADAFSALPGELELVEPAPVEAIAPDGTRIAQAFGRHLVLRVRPDAARRVLLTGHMDTVYPAGDPFQSVSWRDADTLGGPGVADMKGGLAVILGALSAFEASTPSLGYDLLINSDEEAGSLSSAPLIASLAKNKIAALTYEPSALPDGTLAGARGGSGNYSMVITGRSAHAGRNPTEGRNAIVAAAALVVALKALDRPGLRINPARIDGGSANNVVPDNAVVRFNIRPNAPADAEDFSHHLEELMASLAKDHEIAITLHGGMTRPPKPLDPAALRLFALVKDCAASLGQQIAWQDSAGVCDGNNIAACGVPVVDTLGVRGGAIHSPDEYVIVPSLLERAQLSALVLARLDRGASL